MHVNIIEIILIDHSPIAIGFGVGILGELGLVEI